ncbi:MAG TPA: hypothetical protein VIF14_16850 [Alphaproteobacteria bacterium]|jgi:hypothetical protein
MASTAPISETAIRGLAQELVDHYGDGAALAAADRADAMTIIGNAEAARIWTTVAEIIAASQGRVGRPDA